jgi:hypothetical protein
VALPSGVLVWMNRQAGSLAIVKSLVTSDTTRVLTVLA